MCYTIALYSFPTYGLLGRDKGLYDRMAGLLGIIGGNRYLVAHDGGNRFVPRLLNAYSTRTANFPIVSHYLCM
jgi:hypothetical protein